MKDILIVDSISKSFNRKPIITDVSLKCETGDIIGILGRNGSGKSTLLQIIFGSVKAENKFLKVNNYLRNTTFFFNEDISYLPQGDFLPTNYLVRKVIKNFIAHSEYQGFIEDEFIAKILKSKVKNLSGGELKYLGTKLILFKNSKFALLDEPFSKISPILVETIKAQVEFVSNYKGIIITDHKYNDIFDIATKLYIMHNGHLKLIRDKEELIKFNYINFI